MSDGADAQTNLSRRWAHMSEGTFPHGAFYRVAHRIRLCIDVSRLVCIEATLLKKISVPDLVKLIDYQTDSNVGNFNILYIALVASS